MLTQRFSSDNFKIYVVDVDKAKYQTIKKNIRGEFVIVGDLPSLIPNNTYSVIATEERTTNFGYQYKVKNIKMEKPTDFQSTKNFLYEIITENQANILLEVYPDIVDKVIKNDLADIDLNKTKGIKDATFGLIKQKIIENFCLIDLIDLFKGALTLNQIRKIYDKYTSIEKFIWAINHKPYECLCSLSRVGFKTADKILLGIDEYNKLHNHQSKIKFEDDLKTSKQRMRACLEFILDENELNGNTRMSIKELRVECNKLTPECINHFLDCVQEENNNIYVDNDSKCIGTRKAYDTERYIYDTTIELLRQNNVWDIKCELYRDVGDYPLTDEQMGVLYNACNRGISILTAPAGSGKSFSINNLIHMLKDNMNTFMICTPTGKSSEVVAEYTGEDAGTIHRKLEFNPTREGNPWGYNKNNKLDVDIVIIDEFSMVDIYLFNHLLDAIDTAKTKLLLVFDSYQLSSVSCGNVAHDLLNSGLIPTTRLTKIFRYNEGGLMQVATRIRESEEFLDSDFSGVHIFGTKKDFIYSELPQHKMPLQLLKIYQKVLNDGYSIEDIGVLTAQNKGDYGTKAINNHIQKMMQRGKNNKFIMRGDTKFYEGDKVIQIVNNYSAQGIHEEKLDVFNGNTGVVYSVEYNEIVVDFNGKKIVYRKDELDQLELGYCISIHKSQGSSIKQVITIAPRAHTFMMNSNLLYVAVTRARERVYMLGNIITINRAIKKKENLQRNTWLELMFE